MNRKARWSSRWVCPVLAFVLAVAGDFLEPEASAGAGDAGDLSVAVDAGGGVARIGSGERTLLVYAFGAGQYKPYVRELRSWRGHNVLRDAPEDHLHHHGLMLALRVNGVNFWEEREPAGRQVPVGPPGMSVRRGMKGGQEAWLEQDIRWMAAGDGVSGKALLLERRRLRLVVVPGEEEVGLDWHSEFKVGAGMGGVVLHGPDYHGLGMRLPAAFDHVAGFLNGDGLPYSEAQTFDVRPGPWTAVTGPDGAGGEVQVVLASHPGNPGRASYFSMRNAFAYLAATPEPALRPLAFGPGERFAFRYRLLVRDRRLDAVGIGGRLAGWVGRGGGTGRGASRR